MKRRVIILQLDNYSRIMLTIIAVCMAGLFLRQFLNVPIAGAELKEQKDIRDVNIARINGQPPEIALPLRVSIAKARTIDVNIKNSETLPVAIEKSQILPIHIVEPEVLSVDLTSPEVIKTSVVDTITLPVEINGPRPLPVVQTVRRIRPASGGAPSR